MGDLEINISDFKAFSQTAECNGGNTGQSVCYSKNGTYTWFFVEKYKGKQYLYMFV